MKAKPLVLILCILAFGCGKTVTPLDSSGGGAVTPAVIPGKAILLFPAENSSCTTGTTISSTQTSVTFTWNTSTNTDFYELNIENLLTKVTTSQIYSNPTATVTLLTGTPYAWYVVSKTTKNTAQITTSDTWKFYVSGPGSSYAPPFPATIVSPTFNQIVSANNGTVDLTWTDRDPDNDITGYDVYFGTNSAALTLYKGGITNMYLNAVPVTSSKTYYWRILANDSMGNITDSGTYQFTVR